ncbi:cysteine proteinase [Aspergillus heteromorphus CBS 117.55]|uniref:Cysteine proteinase n=1 Tax=Aspergillus heteromorphus CBS 117.55 TaxID=1448321 RepID=A0A317V096_9EURO|nr:cysteine proteinase [Aspergillus heteromorphus CBS 117.55]PWY65610.1 cysteine proteinase [Aspergillus heteromorphus CBS 117.55]
MRRHKALTRGDTLYPGSRPYYHPLRRPHRISRDLSNKEHDAFEDPSWPRRAIRMPPSNRDCDFYPRVRPTSTPNEYGRFGYRIDPGIDVCHEKEFHRKPRSILVKHAHSTNKTVRFREPLVTEYVTDIRDLWYWEDETPETKSTYEQTDDERIVDPGSQPFKFPLGTAVSAVNLVRPHPQPIPEGRTESIYASHWRKMEAEKKKRQQDDEFPARITPNGPAVRPLSSAWEARVAAFKSVPANKTVVTTRSGQPLTNRSLATCYTPKEWLNDEIINEYLDMIIDYLRRTNNNDGRHDTPRFHAFNSFFFTQLQDNGYARVARWAKKAKIGGPDLLKVDKVFIPINRHHHWTLAVVHPAERAIEHFDSLGTRSLYYMMILKVWLRAELGSQYVESEWRLLPSLSPQQDNGSDCGVFLLTTAKAVAVGIEPMAYRARDAILLRRKIVAELVAGGLEDELFPSKDGQLLL